MLAHQQDIMIACTLGELRFSGALKTKLSIATRSPWRWVQEMEKGLAVRRNSELEEWSVESLLSPEIACPEK